MILEVLKFPDPRLREKSQAVKKFGPELRELAKNMLETMYHERGIGLAAPQVGELYQMLVIDCLPREGRRIKKEEDDRTELERKIEQPLVIINPVIRQKRGKTTFEEGCLSVPTFFETVERADWIELEYQDLDGKTQVLQTDGLLAIVIQHEMDHLDGTLFIDHLSFLKSNKIKNQIKKNGYPSREIEPGDQDSAKEPAKEPLVKTTDHKAGRKL